MAARLYLVPIVTEAVGSQAWRGPQYLASRAHSAIAGLGGVVWSGSDYGLEPVMLVAAEVTSTQHTLLSSQAGVTALPLNIDQAIGAAALAAVRDALEAVNIPVGGWITASMTYRQVLRASLVVFYLLQRLSGMGYNVRLFAGEITLGSTIGAIPAATRNALNAAATSLGFDTSSITAAMTIRQTLQALAAQWDLTRELGHPLGDYPI